MKFIGRQEELNIIKKDLNSDKFSCVLLYGRRRVGKTEVISQCIKNRKEKVIFFTASKVSVSDNFELLCKYIAEEYSLSYSFNDFPSLFDFLSEKSKQEKTIVIIDEYSYLRESDVAIDSYLQQFIDKNIHNKNLSIVVSGSLVEIMKSIIDSGEPLYGRFTSIIELKPFDYYEASLFFPNKTSEEKMQLYSVFGGIPHYLKLIDQDKSVEENIIDLFFSKNTVMESEIEVFLNGELSKVESANSVLSFVGNGSKSYQDINQKLSSKKSGNNAAYILNKLVGIGVLDKEIEVNKDNSNRGLYYIQDNALLFFYSYVMPNKNRLSIMSGKALYKKIIEKELKVNYYPKAFEKVCKEFLIRKNLMGEVDDLFYAIGRLTYHDKSSGENYEFDIVSANDNGYKDYECKYQEDKLTNKDIEVEVQQGIKSKFNFYKYGFFSKNGFDKSVDRELYELYTLDDLYKR